VNLIKIKIAKNPAEMRDAFYVRNCVFVNEQKNTIEENLDGFDKDAIHTVIYFKGIIIGCLRIRFFGEKAEFERVCILKKYRNKGFGKIIVEFALDCCKNKTKEITLDAQYSAKKFYKKCGFIVRGKEFEKFGTPHIEMFHLY